MGLGLPKNEAGDFNDIIKYDARAGRMFRIDFDGSEKSSVEITQGFSAIFDLANIQVGWVRFAEKSAPDWAMVRIGQPLPAKPSAEHRQGFKINVKLAKSAGGDLREFGSAAGCVIQAMDELYDAYAAAPEAKAGKLPVVGLSGTVMVKSGSGAKISTNYKPTLTIRQWVDRPAELAAGSTSQVPAQEQPKTNGMVPPPVQQQASAAAMADEF